MAQDAYKYFRIEARELLEQLGQGVLKLEQGASAADAVPHLLRVAHTLKGAARVVKQREIADAAHAIEDALVPFREAAAPVPQQAIDATLGQVDAITRQLAALTAPAETASASAPAPGQNAAGETLQTLRVDVAEMEVLLDGVAEAYAQLAALRGNTQTLERARQLAQMLAKQHAAGLNGAAASGGKSAPGAVVSMAEELPNLVAGAARNLSDGIEQIDRELRQVRDAAERLRLLPAGMLFTLLERTARDAARALGKRIVFEGKGGDVRLDAHVVGALQGALVQLVRNAVAHGIEPEAARRAASKDAEGRVEIAVVRRGKQVAFVCRDDGAGLDVEALRRAALRRGLLEDPARQLNPDELLQLLLKGGISTSGTVTEISGRGVGLDVVRVAAEQLGGSVQVETRPGAGTTIEVLAPVSLSSLDALVVEAGGVRAAMPLEAVRRTLHIEASQVASTPGGQTIVHDGRVIPFLSLDRPLTPNRRGARAARAWPTVVVGSGDAVAAIGVDGLLGTANIVLRPLPALAPGDPIVAGAALDTAGNPQIVLDAAGLVARASRGETAMPPHAVAVRPILIIDDSLTTRMLEQSILEAAGYEVDLATSAEEGLFKARQSDYALFLVDVEMPGMDGYTFVAQTRADAVLRNTPAILVTSRNEPGDRERGEAAGASAYIVKGEFDQTVLLARIRKLMG